MSVDADTTRAGERSARQRAHEPQFQVLRDGHGQLRGMEPRHEQPRVRHLRHRLPPHFRSSCQQRPENLHPRSKPARHAHTFRRGL